MAVVEDMIIFNGNLIIGSDYLHSDGFRIVLDGDEHSRIIYEAFKAAIIKMNLDSKNLMIFDLCDDEFMPGD